MYASTFAIFSELTDWKDHRDPYKRYIQKIEAQVHKEQIRHTSTEFRCLITAHREKINNSRTPHARDLIGLSPLKTDIQVYTRNMR